MPNFRLISPSAVTQTILPVLDGQGGNRTLINDPAIHYLED